MSENEAEEQGLDLEINIFSVNNLTYNGGNIFCKIDFTDFLWDTKVIKKMAPTLQFNQRFNVGSFDEQDVVYIYVCSKRVCLGVVTVNISDLNEHSREQQEYELKPTTEVECVDNVTGSITLSFAFVEDDEATMPKKKRGFFRKLCAFLLRTPSKDRNIGEIDEPITTTSGTPPRESEDERTAPTASQTTEAEPDARTESELDEEIIPETQLFNIPIEEVMEKQKEKYPELEVPYFIHEVARYIREQEGIIDTVGLFRVRGRLKEIKELKQKLNNGYELKLDSSVNIHNVTSLVKSFLRELPTPLITHDHYQSFLKAADCVDRKREKKILQTIKQLPQINQTVIRFLLELMHDISLHSDQNKMHSENLGKVLSPNLLWKEKVDLCDLSQVRDMKQANELAQVMILKYHEMFGPDADYSECSESEVFSELSDSDDEEEDVGGRGGLDDLIGRMKKGQGFRKTVSEGTGPAAEQELNPMKRRMMTVTGRN